MEIKVQEILYLFLNLPQIWHKSCVKSKKKVLNIWCILIESISFHTFHLFLELFGLKIKYW